MLLSLVLAAMMEVVKYIFMANEQGYVHEIHWLTQNNIR
jgi:hypothetical protein